MGCGTSTNAAPTRSPDTRALARTDATPEAAPLTGRHDADTADAREAFDRLCGASFDSSVGRSRTARSAAPRRSRSSSPPSRPVSPRRRVVVSPVNSRLVRAFDASRSARSETADVMADVRAFEQMQPRAASLPALVGSNTVGTGVATVVQASPFARLHTHVAHA
eukprot:CAMPEP_0174855958 /NCGR_PEP_ID=MMETSP1114-20130205/34685_1 /TAXON_ID=312471 /ORGANISM="Neobodo designis, Strain CCAP 1951/1" /LENGTH=164 /DNA_ID=CAMNT_0016090733 /DNA_START=106 /DNA_END=600 /DNA_ORIENTATION=+